MKTIFATTAAFLLCCNAAHAAEAVTPDLFGTLPNVSEAAISPDGKRVAFLQNNETASGVAVYDLDNPNAKPIGVTVGNMKARNIIWADDEHVLVLVSAIAHPYHNDDPVDIWRWVSVFTSTGETIPLFKKGCGGYTGSGALLATTPKSLDDAVFSHWCATGIGLPRHNLWRVELSDGKKQRLEIGTNKTDQWIVDENGEAAARVDYESSQQKRRIRIANEGGGFREIASFDEKKIADPVIQLVGLSPDRRHLLALRYGDGGRRSLVALNTKTGAIGAPLYSNETYDIAGAIYDSSTAAAIGVSYIDDLPRSFYLDAEDHTLQQQLRKALPGAAPIIVSRSLDGSRMIVRVSYTDGPDQIFLFDRSKKALSKISATYNELDGKTYAHKEKYDYAAPDGRVIHGYLTVPKGAAKKNMPLIVLPHGGPAGRDDQSFDWWSFFYAARGYLVYQPNFRGSDGYGEAFKEAGYGEWGRKMQDDITNGVKKLVADGIADPKRICIVGASYGGYAALAGATLTPGLYACAVSVAGISDLVVMIGDDARWSKEASDYWTVHIGSRFRERDELEKTSPDKMAYRAKAPILLIHGKDDSVVPFKQSEFMRDALEANGKTVEFVELEGEDHWLSRGKTRTEMLAKSIAFIDRYIGPKPAKAAEAPP